MTDFVFGDFARTTLGGAKNASNKMPLTAQQLDQIVVYLESSGSGPDGVGSYADYLSRKLEVHPPTLPSGVDYVGYSGKDRLGNSNFDNARTYVADLDKKAAIIGDTPWGEFIEGAKFDQEFRVIQGKFTGFMKSQGFAPFGDDYGGALRDMMWNAGSPKYFENAIATGKPILAFVENAPEGRGFSTYELPTALKYPNAVINGYPLHMFEPDPLAFASKSAAQYQSLERTIAQAATANGGQEVSVAQVRHQLKIIDGYDAPNQMLFNRPID